MDLESPNVSRETLDQLHIFADLVRKWTVKINLISKSSIPDIWARHILDSVQVHSLAPQSGKWVDLGSGGGFPGIVAAIMSKGGQLRHDFVLVESDQRKAVFLRTAIRELDLNATVEVGRIEQIMPLSADILSARALTDLDQLLEYAELHLSSTGTALFPKGARWEKERDAARMRWSYTCDPIRSKTSPDASILKIKDIARV